MSNLTILNIEPIIPNRDAFTRRDVARAVMRLGYTKDRRDAYYLVDAMLAEAFRARDVAPVDEVSYVDGSVVRKTSRTYRIRRNETNKQLEAMFSLLLQTQQKLAAAETELQNIKRRHIHVV